MKSYFKSWPRRLLLLCITALLLLAGAFTFYKTTLITESAEVSPSDLPIAVDVIRPEQRPALAHLLTLLKPNDPDSIFAVFDAIQSDPALKYYCHSIAHSLGHHTYELYGFADAMTYNNPLRTQHTPVEEICGGGYMHGILEETLAHKPSLSSNPGVLCANVPDAIRWNCYHGVGHALMFIYKRDLSRSLDTCRTLATPLNQYCFEGVWMELFLSNTEHAGPNTLGWDIDDPLASCLHAEADTQHQCYFYVSLGYILIHQNNFKGAVRMCTDSRLTDLNTGVCLTGLGTKLLPYLGGRHLAASESYAALLTKKQKPFFYSGLFNYALVSGLTIDELTAECKLLVTDSGVCLQSLSTETQPN